ncbi:uncharacterized protein LOC106878087 [Octopus bimaculoides]|uniref:uncharacterized protein LOC106878087 n=1 Tax=Octopus bimaculoides TaxID=37653 RepID=UPI00071C4E05|nr:uncharacterized protein LOC106878087 [Octopus bimaculoides]|eukprot:XP_014782672.1 PREDICTED: uncharacterized protein LOC106878087 [Octopus bimaculoides]
MLSACPKALQSGWKTLRHNLVLNVDPSAATEGQVPELSLLKTAFVKQGVMPKRQKPRQGKDGIWEVLVDKPLPDSIIVSVLRPDLVLVDEGQRRVVFGQLTVPWEDNIAEAHERKLLGGEELVAEIQEKSYICELVAFKVSCSCIRGFPAASLRRFLKVAGVSAVRKTIKECGEKAVDGSSWITRRFMLVFLTADTPATFRNLLRELSYIQQLQANHVERCRA